MSCSSERTYESPLIIQSEKFSKVVKKLREFFLEKNFIDELYQLELNLDIFRMSKDQIISKLNKAFNDRVEKNK